MCRDCFIADARGLIPPSLLQSVSLFPFILSFRGRIPPSSSSFLFTEDTATALGLQGRMRFPSTTCLRVVNPWTALLFYVSERRITFSSVQCFRSFFSHAPGLGPPSLAPSLLFFDPFGRVLFHRMHQPKFLPARTLAMLKEIMTVPSTFPFISPPFPDEVE